MKILFGVPILVHKEIAEAEVTTFRKLGLEVETAYYGNSGYVKGTINSIIRVLKNAVFIKWKLHKQKSDIIYLNSAFDQKSIVRDAVTVLIIRLYTKNIKIVLKLHGSVEAMVLKQTGFIARLKRFLLKNIDLLLLLSTEERANFLKIGIQQERLLVTANPLNKSFYIEDKLFKQSVNPEKNAILLLFVGRLIKEKGILDLVDACEILNRKGLKFKLYCLGDGREKIIVSEKIAAHGLANQIELVGYIPEEATRPYYANCDILILPSYSEGFPMAVFQAIAAGKPVITTKIRGAADHLKEGINCLWATIGSAESIAEKIIELATDEMLRENMRRNNLLLAEEFSKEKLSEQTIKALEALLQRRKLIDKGDKEKPKNEIKALENSI
jgi:glycosyltransferase involved in cell wall biosynthesis